METNEVEIKLEGDKFLVKTVRNLEVLKFVKDSDGRRTTTIVKKGKKNWRVRSITTGNVPISASFKNKKMNCRFEEKEDKWIQVIEKEFLMTPEGFLREATNVRSQRDKFLQTYNEYNKLDEIFKKYEVYIKEARKIIDETTKAQKINNLEGI